MPFTSKPVLKYFDLTPLGPIGARGNVIRLFMLTNKIAFEEKLTTFAEWGAQEKEEVTAKYNPAGHLPIVLIGDKCYAEHMAVCRYLSRQEGTYGNDPESDYLVDVAADAYADWSNAWTALLTKGSDDPAVKDYVATHIKYYKTLEWYYSKKPSDSPFLVSGEKPSFADVAVFNQLRDDAVQYPAVDLAAFPNLQALQAAMKSRPEVTACIDKIEASCKA